MKVVPLEGSTLTIAELVEMAREGAVILTREGQPLATVRDVTGSDWESAALANDPRPARASPGQAQVACPDEARLGSPSSVDPARRRRRKTSATASDARRSTGSVRKVVAGPR